MPDKVIMDKRKAIRIETEIRVNGGPRHTYIFRCSYEGCTREIRVRGDALKKHSSLCLTHSHRGRPFESIYRGLFKDPRGIPVTLTYDEYMETVAIENCHYCDKAIERHPYGTVAGEYKSRAYFLDRKDNNQGYTKDNCVACCTECNILRGNRFTYEEFLLLAPALRKIEESRGA